MRNMSLEVASLPFHSSPPKGCKQANTPAPALFERSKNPRTRHFHGSFSESSQTSHLHPDSLVTYGCVCGNSLGILSCPQNLVFSSAQPLCNRLPVPRGSCVPLSAPISPSRHPLACQSSRVPAHTVYPGASLHRSSLSSGAFPKPCIFMSMSQSAVICQPPQGGCLGGDSPFSCLRFFFKLPVGASAPFLPPPALPTLLDMVRCPCPLMTS